MRLHVVAAVLQDGQGRVLITQRPAGKHMAGYWEFPGGKVAQGETVAEALVRELAEELGIRALRWRALLALSHAYADRDVDLEVYEVTAYEGEPAGLEGQPLRWVALSELPSQALLPADDPIVAALARDAATGAAADAADAGAQRYAATH